jgi:hypothetical protein
MKSLNFIVANNEDRIPRLQRYQLNHSQPGALPQAASLRACGAFSLFQAIPAP